MKKSATQHNILSITYSA